VSVADQSATSPRLSRGFGRVLVLVYAVFGVSASARAIVQIARDVSEAPVAYVLSAFAAAIYVVATIALARDARRTATAAVVIELVGVLVVGALSLTLTEEFPRATVWSGFGQGYAYVPLVLPFVGLWWLWRTHRAGAPSGSAGGGGVA
jgi:hypothetical protein